MKNIKNILIKQVKMRIFQYKNKKIDKKLKKIKKVVDKKKSKCYIIRATERNGLKKEIDL